MTFRFRDDGRTIHDFAAEVLVRCPRCAGRAVVRPIGESPDGHHWTALRCLTCPACGAIREQTAPTRIFGRPSDPYLDLPLWLTTPVDGQQLWAYNGEHLDVLERFVAAELRERSTGSPPRPMSMIEKLPDWIGAAGHRDRVLAAIARLRRERAEPVR